ncbi:MAG TPA: 4-hydroxy-tetrahydrodipicolinate reductase [Polyangiaceae bacterium]|nr:4-hydroxy-tetrahydrodipicolinate reductase [Polyangiaceae bacterium]
MKLAIFGATGRMGLAIVRLSQEDSSIQIVGGICGPDDKSAGRDLGDLAGTGTLGVVATPDLASGLLGADVVIDFSNFKAAPALFATAARQRVAIVSGTTNLDEPGMRALDKAAEHVPVLWAANMSLGVQIMAELVEYAVRRLGAEFDVEIMEVHHKRKVDAPSGTAKRLAQAARAARTELTELSSRVGDVGARTPSEIGIFGLRGGDVIGDHTVFLFGPGERIELTHRASNRDLFARGALRAASFLAGKAPGRYTIKDVLTPERA